jgi:hypothetical protein
MTPRKIEDDLASLDAPKAQRLKWRPCHFDLHKPMNATIEAASWLAQAQFCLDHIPDQLDTELGRAEERLRGALGEIVCLRAALSMAQS